MAAKSYVCAPGVNAVEIAVQQRLVRIEAGQVHTTADIHEIAALDQHPAVAAAPVNPVKGKG